MIDTKELRLKNIVRFIDGSISTVEAIGLGSVELRDVPYSVINTGIEPIPLTPAVLEACGFEFRYESSRVMLLIIGDHKTETEQSLQFWINTDHISISRCGINAYSAPCDNLHQLQNIYYSLTGQELQIDIEKLKNAIK
jgi:hypothetical protein